MFQAPKMTDAGKALYYDSLAGQGIVFTKIKLGQGAMTQPIATMTGLVDTVLSIDAAMAAAGDQSYVEISGSFSNADLSEGFYWREIGLFAANPAFPDDRSKDILYCYQNAYDTADFIPAASVETVEKHIVIPLVVSDAAQISCLLDSSLIYAAKKDVDAHIQNQDLHTSSEEKQSWNNKATPDDIRKSIVSHNNSQDAHLDIRKAAKTAQNTADKALEALNKLVYTIEVVPSQQGTLTYTGSPQSPAWNSYNPEVMTLGGVTSATDAGTYTATFTPKENYSWADGSTAAKSVPWTIQRQAVAVPSQSGTLTYTGSAQSPSWSGYDSAKLTIGGTTSGTNAGSYSATFTPKANYQWSDGTTGAKSVTWAIGKAAGSLALSKTAVSLNTSALSDTVTVTRTGTGAITAQSSNSSIATVTVSGNTLTITGKATGTATITVSVDADGNYTAPANKTVEVTVQLVSTVLAENSWATIGQVCAERKHKDYWQVGDEKDIVVNGETLTLAIMDFDHDDLSDGSGKAPITFGLKNLMAETRVINSTLTNVGGFTGSEIYAWLQNTLLPALPSDLKNVIKSVNKKTSAGNKSNTINTNAMKLFLFSEIEIFGSTTYSVAGEGSQYSYFATVANRIKNLQNGAGSANSWWERSPDLNSSSALCRVSSIGNASTDYANFLRGVCFGFCV